MSYYASGLPMLSSTGYNVYSEVDAYRAQVAYIGNSGFILNDLQQYYVYIKDAYNPNIYIKSEAILKNAMKNNDITPLL